jgi:class 3 adenylate cyclase
MQSNSNRTLICSVVFLDIVGYSKKPVSEQIQIKERLNALLTEALANVAVNDRIILDTGDGAALSFIGDPEDALFVSLTLRDALAGPQPEGPEMKVRIGINLGPVKLVKDINGHPNIIGDGINVAQRVMSFAEPGEVLVSRSYYEVVSCMSEEYVKLFHYGGSRTDKHVREHEVYAVLASGEALQRVAAATDTRMKKKSPDHSGAVVIDKLAQSASYVTTNLRRKPRLGTAFAVIAILAVAVGLRANRQPPAPVAKPSLPTRVTAAPTPAPAKAAATETARAPAAQKPAATPAKEKAPAVQARKPPSPTPAATAATAPVTAAPAAAVAEAKPSAPGGSGILQFTIRPWGEIYVDGRHEGDVPPLYELRIAAGRHKLEIRHPEFPPYIQTVDVKPGAKIQIRHQFQPKVQPIPIPMPWK